MKTIILIGCLVSVSMVYASSSCPQATFPENQKIGSEFNNVCYNIAYPNIVNATVSSMTVRGIKITSGTISNVTISTFTASSATITGLSVTSLYVPGTVGVATNNSTQLVNHPLTVAKDVAAPADHTTNAQLGLTGSTNLAKQMSLGYDTTGGYGFLQAATQGTSYDPIIINKDGGRVDIRGSSTNDSAASGFVGERLASAFASSVNLGGSGVFTTATSVPLTAGDWEVFGQLEMDLNGSTLTGISRAALSVNTGNTTTDHIAGDNMVVCPAPTSSAPFYNESVCYILSWRVSLASTTTIYLKGLVTYSAGTPVMFAGKIAARRMR